MDRLTQQSFLLREWIIVILLTHRIHPHPRLILEAAANQAEAGRVEVMTQDRLVILEDQAAEAIDDHFGGRHEKRGEKRN